MQYKWWQMRLVKFTPQYRNGVIAGLGVGLVFGVSLPYDASYSILGRMLGFILVAIGCNLQMREQEKAADASI
jgi:hypothetical protein